MPTRTLPPIEPEVLRRLRARWRVKLFDRLKHYYTSIACWAAAAKAAVLVRRKLSSPSLPPRQPRTRSAALVPTQPARFFPAARRSVRAR